MWDPWRPNIQKKYKKTNIWRKTMFNMPLADRWRTFSFSFLFFPARNVGSLKTPYPKKSQKNTNIWRTKKAFVNGSTGAYKTRVGATFQVSLSKTAWTLRTLNEVGAISLNQAVLQRTNRCSRYNARDRTAWAHQDPTPYCWAQTLPVDKWLHQTYRSFSRYTIIKLMQRGWPVR